MPGVTIDATRAFSKAWDSGGIKILLDETALRFATDWANIVLKSFVEQQMRMAQAMKAAEVPPTNTVATRTAPPSPPQKSSIILTD
jgi:hypothetical protein